MTVNYTLDGLLALMPKIDIGKPLQLVIEANTKAGQQSPHPVEYVTHCPDGVIVKHKLGGAKVQVSMYDWQGEPIAGTPSWRIENVPPEPIKKDMLAVLYQWGTDINVMNVLNMKAVDDFFRNSPGKVLGTKWISVTSDDHEGSIG